MTRPAKTPNTPDSSMIQPASRQWLIPSRITNEPGNQQQQAKDIGEDQGTGDRLPHQHDAKRDVQDAEKHLPDEPAPSLGPERVDDLESARNDGDPSDEDGADHGDEHDVPEHKESRQDHDEPEQNANPEGRRRQFGDADRRTVVIGRHVISPRFKAIEPAGTCIGVGRRQTNHSPPLRTDASPSPATVPTAAMPPADPMPLPTPATTMTGMEEDAAAQAVA